MRLRLKLLPLTFLICRIPLAAQNVQVNSADPNVAAQGTVNIDVAVGGSGFKQGANAQWFVTGTTNPGGVTVNSTRFVSSTQLAANITVSDNAAIASFDIMVANTNGRSGKGTGLFSVLAKGSQACVLSPLPSRFTLVGTLNHGAYTGFGVSVRIHQVTLGGRQVLLAGVGTAAGGALEVFFLDPDTGAVLDGTAIGSNSHPQPHITKPVTIPGGGTIGMRHMAIGDLNADGVPDIVVSGAGIRAAFVGSVDGSGILTYSDPILFPAVPTLSADGKLSVAMGNVDGIPGDEVAVADPGAKKAPGGVYIYRFNGAGFSLLQTIPQPAASLAVGDVVGDASPDLIVGDPNAVNTLVYSGPSFSSSLLMPPGPTVGVAHVTGGVYSDLIAAPALSGGRVDVFSGPVFAGEAPAFSVFPLEVNDLDTGDVNGDGLADILIGAPNTAPSNQCPPSVGTAYVYLTNAATPNQPTAYALQPPTLDVDFGGYGWSVGAANGAPLFLVGEDGRNINGVVNAGQVYVYKVNP